jgi:hypothetical protein
MKNITPRVLLRRALTLLLLGTAILVQSCSKESDSVTPQLSTERVAAPSSLDSLNNPSKTRSDYRFLSTKSSASSNAVAGAVIAIYPVSGSLGSQVDLLWNDFDYTPSGQHASPTAHVELTGPAHIILPHVNLKSYFGNTGATNGFTFTIPPYVPTGSYNVYVTADAPYSSVVHDPGYPDAEGTLTITSASVTTFNGLKAVTGVNPPPRVGGGYLIDGKSFSILWPAQQYASSTLVRFGLQSASGVYYLLARPNLLGVTDNYATGTSPYSMNNVFDNASGEFKGGEITAQIVYSMSDVPSGTYTMYLDNYSTTYTFSAASSTGSTITLP